MAAKGSSGERFPEVRRGGAQWEKQIVPYLPVHSCFFRSAAFQLYPQSAPEDKRITSVSVSILSKRLLTRADILPLSKGFRSRVLCYGFSSGEGEVWILGLYSLSSTQKGSWTLLAVHLVCQYNKMLRNFTMLGTEAQSARCQAALAREGEG